MAIREILKYPDPRLKIPTAAVSEDDETAGHLVEDLLDTLYSTKGIALSAPQIGEEKDVLVMDLSEARNDPQIFVNPQIHSKRAWGFVEESCLSLPGVVGNVLRATQLEVRARDGAGNEIEQRLQGMEAVCLQHEMDHLAGRIFIDRMSIVGRVRSRLKMLKYAQIQREAA